VGALKRILLTVPPALLVLIAIYYCFRFIAAYNNGYSWEEMDWNKDGSTSFSELIESSDVGKRAVEVDGKNCVEYFAFKDGLPLKTVCP
jgi:hypothetical protein